MVIHSSRHSTVFSTVALVASLAILLGASGCAEERRPVVVIKDEKKLLPPKDLPIYVRIRPRPNTEPTPNDDAFRVEIEKWLGPPGWESLTEYPERGLRKLVVQEAEQARIIMDIESELRSGSKTSPGELSVRYRIRGLDAKTHAAIVTYPSRDLTWRHHHSENAAEQTRELAKNASDLLLDDWKNEFGTYLLKTRDDGTTYVDASGPLAFTGAFAGPSSPSDYAVVKQRVCLSVDDDIPQEMRHQIELTKVINLFFYDQFRIQSELVSGAEFADYLVKLNLSMKHNDARYQRVDKEGRGEGPVLRGEIYTLHCEVLDAKTNRELFSGEAIGETQGNVISADLMAAATTASAAEQLERDVHTKGLLESVREAIQKTDTTPSIP